MATPTTLLDESTLARSQAGAAAGLHLLVMGPKQFATFALPARGEVIVGRGGGDGVDVKLDDAKASRRHLRLHVGDDIEVEDLGSANGTRVHDRKLAARTRGFACLPGEAIAVGSLVLMVQPNRRCPCGGARPTTLARRVRGARRVGVRARRGDRRNVLRRARAGAAGRGPPDVAYGCDSDDRRRRPLSARASYALLLPGLAGDTARGAGRGLRAAAGRRRAGASALRAIPATAATRRAAAARGCARAGRAPRRRAAPVARSPVSRRACGACRRWPSARPPATSTCSSWARPASARRCWRERFTPRRRARRGRWLPINCAALSPTLLESELFGHERGAFTGAGAGEARPARDGARRHGLPRRDRASCRPRLQAKLLRVIETREVLRVGGVRPRKIDVRFIAATNRDLEAEAARGRFRRDLYFRLNGMTLTIPPLRERPARHPASSRARSLARSRSTAAPPARSRDLGSGDGGPARARLARATSASCATSIERALLLCDGPVLLPEHLPRPVPPLVAVGPGGAAAARAGATSARASSRRWPRAAATRAAPRASSGSRARC